MAGDWIKLHRRMLDSAVMQDDWLCRLWIWCLLKANFAPRTVFGIEVQPGQFVTGRLSAAAELGVTPSRFYRGMQRLSGLGQVTLSSDSHRTTVTVCKWSNYQLTDDEERTAIEQQSNSNRTASERLIGQQTDTREEGKNERREERKKGRTPFRAPSVDEVGVYCRERGNRVDPQRFVDHYTAKGWMIGKNPMKDWRAAVRTWEKNDRERGHYDRPQTTDRFGPADGGRSPRDQQAIEGADDADAGG